MSEQRDRRMARMGEEGTCLPGERQVTREKPAGQRSGPDRRMARMGEQSGFVIRVDGKFISAILANGHTERPVVYFTGRLEDAKTWKTPQGVRKARAQAGRGGMILMYRQDTPAGPRVLCGMLAKNGEVSL